ncbi:MULTISPECIES: methionine ABC transporter permease [Clostridium]|jgi:D-methionine transport system permease protein|uniref:Putative D-methionine transport system permease protein MetI n=1 Tax=Clostridium saccharoperbutylacetonicum N1-4(HMT) TaxID=931276 RepID=M1MRR9_9CLOT|nr:MULTISPECIES: methionine ABC transporter permease [Clostridium]AGF58848.1 putative D-methionine transport system permease protein MetI [Clostridium saccharoperbutylacetonicum N1-4(HMT)]AQR97529.1 methionine import system permease protein MetP [Clostridium saccharoperbutylacetonicum]NRT60368.1 D-methionine transport system permease protein [Clostridium saccharoperbutylacetonicum]NSB23681.1 D-methionine transport system permease protein [Clostridium saccharoperbutylacetonicum]NSB33413.1 D-met
MSDVIGKALIETLEMVFASTLGSLILGFIPAIILTVTAKDGLKPNKIVYSVLDLIINILRSFPVIILMVAIIPLTRFIAGKSIGTEAAIVPLTIAAAPFVARIIESALREVDKGIIEAAKSFGASNTQIIFKVMLKEAIPSIASGITLTIISIVGYSAMAGTIGGGGLGQVAISYGYQRFQTDYMVVTCIVLIIVVQGLQVLGNYFYNKLSK